MKVYIAPNGIGLGHVTRCEPIARKLIEKGVDVAIASYLDGLDYAKKIGFKTIESFPISYRVRHDGSIDFKLTAATSGFSLGGRKVLKQTIKEIRNLKQYKPNVVFSDSRASPLIAAKLLEIPSILMLNQYTIHIVKKPSINRISLMDKFFFFIANISWIFIRTLIKGVWGLSDFILIPDFPPPFTICINNLAIPKRYLKKVKFIGPMITAKPNQIDERTRLKEKFGFNPYKKVIYAQVSGPKIDRNFFSKKLIKLLSNLSNKYEIILSKGEFDGTNYPKKVDGITVYDWIDSFTQYEIIKACDLIISRAGHGTIMKALSYGKPLILIPEPDQTEQYANARRASQLKFAKVIFQNQLNEKSISDAIEQILNSNIYSKRAFEISKMASKLDAINSTIDLIIRIAKL
ncbi:MAG: glycosyltransferase [Candidatus Bathyarchaeia archaeon]